MIRPAENARLPDDGANFLHGLPVPARVIDLCLALVEVIAVVGKLVKPASSKAPQRCTGSSHQLVPDTMFGAGQYKIKVERGPVPQPVYRSTVSSRRRSRRRATPHQPAGDPRRVQSHPSLMAVVRLPRSAARHVEARPPVNNAEPTVPEPSSGAVVARAEIFKKRCNSFKRVARQLV